MPEKVLQVLVVGGGIGGLCLAQGLRKAGIQVKVFERDHTVDARLDRYRLTSTQQEHVPYAPVSPMRSGIGSWRQSDGQVAASFSSMSSCTSCSASRTP